MIRRRTPEQEEDILDNIETVANGLSEQVGELQTFLHELKKIRHPTETIGPSQDGQDKHE